MGTYSVVILNRGVRDGLEVGHVLGLYRSEGSIPLGDEKLIALPEQRYGLVLVFRTFEKMAYGAGHDFAPSGQRARHCAQPLSSTARNAGS